MKKSPLITLVATVYLLSFASPGNGLAANPHPKSSAETGFNPTGSMNVARSRHQATLLPNGKVLVTGGYTYPLYTATNTAEIYDPVTGTWRYTLNPMNIARGEHQAVSLLDGRVLIFGGANSSGSLDSAEIFDPATETFTLTQSMANVRHGFRGIRLNDGRVFAISGRSSATPYVTPTNEIFDPTSETWSAAPSLAAGVTDHSATLLHTGQVLIAGGYDGYTSSAYDSVYVYTPSTNSLISMSGLLMPRQDHGAAILPDGKVIIVDGTNYSQQTVQTTEIYDATVPPNGQSVPASSTNEPRRYNTITSLPNGDIIVTGGYQIASSELRSYQTGTWSSAGTMSTPRALHTATLLMDGRLLVVGGDATGNGEILNTAELLGNISGYALSFHSASPTASPSPFSNVNAGIDDPLQLQPDETLLRNQPSVVQGLVADGVTPLLIEFDSNSVSTQPTTFTFSTSVTGGTVKGLNDVNGYLRVLQQTNGQSQFVKDNTVTLSSAHPSGFAYISGINSEDVQFASNSVSNELNITLFATQAGQSSPSTAAAFKIRKPPIVLVHGYNSSNSAWYTNYCTQTPNNFLNTLLFNRPSDFVIPVEYGVQRSQDSCDCTFENGCTLENTKNAFEALAPILDQQLTSQIEGPNSALHQQWAFTRYDIVGHSQGGVLARMLCTDDNPSSAGYPEFQSFRSANNAKRGRFHRVITIGSPHNGSTAVHYLLDMLYSGVPFQEVFPFVLEEKGLLQDKFDPFGAQIKEINNNHWHVDAAAKFNLIGTTIYGGQAPPIVPILSPTHIYVLAGLCWPIRGNTVLPNGSDGVVDQSSEFAGVLPAQVSSGYTPIQGINISHAPGFTFPFDTQTLFGVADSSDYDTASDVVASNVMTLLDGPSTSFAPFFLLPTPPQLQGAIDLVVPTIIPYQDLIQLFQSGQSTNVIANKPSGSKNRVVQPTRTKVKSGRSNVALFGGTNYEYHVVPPADHSPSSAPNWYAQVFGPSGVTSVGATVTPDSNDQNAVSIVVDDSVVGDVLLYANYTDTNGNLITGTPVIVVSRPAGTNLTGIELVPNAISLTTGSSVPSEIWADYDNGARSEVYVTGDAAAYTSDDNSIASVDANGKISLLSPGSTIVHASYLGFSAQTTVTVSAPPPPPVISALYAASRKIHGDAGPFDIDLPFTGTPGIECRSGGDSGNHQVLVTFASPVTINNASLARGAVGNSTFTVNGNVVTVNLTGVSDAQTFDITLSGVSNGITTGDITIPISILLGDVSGDGVVNVGDTAQVRNAAGQTLDSTNFRFDVNADGFINVGDTIVVRSKSGDSLP